MEMRKNYLAAGKGITLIKIKKAEDFSPALKLVLVNKLYYFNISARISQFCFQFF